MSRSYMLCLPSWQRAKGKGQRQRAGFIAMCTRKRLRDSGIECSPPSLDWQCDCSVSTAKEHRKNTPAIRHNPSSEGQEAQPVQSEPQVHKWEAHHEHQAQRAQAFDERAQAMQWNGHNPELQEQTLHWDVQTLWISVDTMVRKISPSPSPFRSPSPLCLSLSLCLCPLPLPPSSLSPPPVLRQSVCSWERSCMLNGTSGTPRAAPKAVSGVSEPALVPRTCWHTPP